MKKESKNKELVEAIIKNNKSKLVTGRDVNDFAKDFITEDVPDCESAISGAMDIM